MYHNAAKQSPKHLIVAQCNIVWRNAPCQGVAMSNDVENVILLLKQRFRAATDQGLADRLSLGRSTITSWRRRGTVPDRYVRMAEIGTSMDFKAPYSNWSDVEKAAMTLALMRLVKGYGAKFVTYPSFLSHGGFLGPQLMSAMEKALIDLSSQMTDRGMDNPHQCVNLIVFEEFFDPK